MVRRSRYLEADYHKVIKQDVQHTLNVEQVCALVRCSSQTLYRLRKDNPHGEVFPCPHKVASTAARGPRAVNRWDRDEVMGWLRGGNAPRWHYKAVLEGTEEGQIGQGTGGRGARCTVHGPREGLLRWCREHELGVTAVIGGLLASAAAYILGG